MVFPWFSLCSLGVFLLDYKLTNMSYLDDQGQVTKTLRHMLHLLHPNSLCDIASIDYQVDTACNHDKPLGVCVKRVCRLGVLRWEDPVSNCDAVCPGALASVDCTLKL